MEINVVEDKRVRGDWRVEMIDQDGDGDVRVAIFSGPHAEIRARTYAAWYPTLTED